MNPSVINGGVNSAAQQQQQQQQQQQSPQSNQPQAPGAGADGNNNSNNNSSQAHTNASHHHQPSNVRPPTGAAEPRSFSSPFSSGGRFPFDDSDDDMFGDLDMRARMNRMGAFDWGAHKRGGGSGGGVGGHHFADADSFFKDDFGFPSTFGGAGPQFDAFNRAKNAGRRAAPAPAASSPSAATASTTGGAAPVGAHHDRSQFYDHLPEEFRQYFPESFGHSFPRMRAHQQAAASPPSGSFVRHHVPQQQHPAEPEHFVHAQQPQYHPAPQAPTPVPAPRPKLCDAAIQTDTLPAGGTDLQQPAGLRNTVDLGQRSQQEPIVGADRAQSAPPTEPFVAAAPSAPSGPYQTAAGTFANTGSSMTPQSGAGTPQTQFNYPSAQQQQQSTPTTAERHVPIFVEGRAAGPPTPPQRTSQPPLQPQQQQKQPSSRPTPFIANDQTDSAGDAVPSDVPQTPHTADCINKIQKIQSDVLDLMGEVDRFAGCRRDKEYMYIDEMLTRNLLKLDTIDTQGRESIRLARKEAIRCIQASITVLEAKAEQNSNRKKAESTTAATPAVQGNDVVVETPPASVTSSENIEQSLEEKLADFQRKSEEREVAASAAEPETHVSAVQINLKPAVAKPE